MPRYNHDYAFERIKLLQEARKKDLNVVRFGTIAQLNYLLTPTTLVIVYTRPVTLTEIQWAYQDGRDHLGAEFVGNMTGPTSCIKNVQVGSRNWGIVYKNPTGWRIEKTHLTMKWGNQNRTPSLNFPIYMTETVNGRIVRVSTSGFGVNSLGIEDMNDFTFKILEQELRKKNSVN